MRRDNEFRYSRLAHILREQIMSGFIKPGEYLLSENELCRYYGLSRTSVRKSLEQLQKEGLIVKKVGQGTIVSPDLVIPKSERRTLRILTNSPSYFADTCLGTIIDAFRQQYPYVDVKLLAFPSWNFWDSVRASIELGHYPDLLLTTDRHFSEMNREDTFLDLREHFGELIAQFYPRVAEPFRHGESQTAIPVTFSTVYTAYNPDLFARYGVEEPKENWSLEEMEAAARRLTLDSDGDGITDQYGFWLSSGFNRWPVVALQNGFRLQPGVERDAVVRTLRFFHDAVYRKRLATMHASSNFVREKAAMTLTTAIELAGWRNEGMSFEPKVAPLQFGPVQSTLLLANALMVYKEGQERELALAFIRTAFDPALQARLSRETGFLSCMPSINRSVWDERYLRSIHIGEDNVENSYYLHELMHDLSEMDELAMEMQLYWGGLESAENCADRIMALLNEPTGK